MRGLRLFPFFCLEIDEDQKNDLHVRRCRVFTENIGDWRRPKIRSLLFVMRPLIFSEALGFSLLSLYVNPALTEAVN